MNQPASPDRFGSVADAYATFRPRYPDELYSTLAQLAAGSDLAWDCATGNGQAAAGLARHFGRVVATDFSRGQLACALTHDRVSYIRARAEAAPIRSGAVDLITVAQALHWFDIESFWREVRRVLRPDGLVAVWCYNLARATPAIDRVVDAYYRDIVGPYWAPNRRLTEDGYLSVSFPFETVGVREFEISADLGIDEVIGYIGTWSATLALRAATGEDPLPALRSRLERVWPETAKVTARWPIRLRAGRNRPQAAG